MYPLKSQRRALAVCRLLGVFPVVESGNGFVTSKCWFIYSTIFSGSIIFYQIVQIHSAFTGKSGDINFTTVLEIGNKCFRIAMVSCSFYVVKHRQTLNAFSSTLSEAGIALKRVGYNLNSHRKLNVFGWLLILQVFVTNIAEFSLTKTTLDVRIPSIFDIVAFHLLLCGVVLQFSSFATAIDEKLDSLNFAASNFVKRYGTSGRGDMLLLLSDAHCLLTTSSVELDNVYYRTYFGLVSGAVWTVTATAYQLAESVYGPKGNFFYPNGLKHLFWVIFWTLLLATITLPCTSASKKSKVFNEILAKIIMRGYKFDEPNQKKRLQIHVDFDYTVRFSCGFFELNRSLLHSILGGVSSFAVILIQISGHAKS